MNSFRIFNIASNYIENKFDLIYKKIKLKNYEFNFKNKRISLP
jgi:hypothetical protein